MVRRYINPTCREPSWLFPRGAAGLIAPAEAPVCLTSFVLYLASNVPPDPALVAPMCVGAMVGAPIGARQTALTDTTRLKRTIGVLLIALGVWALVGGSA